MGKAGQEGAAFLNASFAADAVEVCLRFSYDDPCLVVSADKTPEGAVRMTTYFFGFLFYLAAVLLGAA
ncbi:hypothetical protein ABT116_27670, partial [Streptomyces sp. NPDC002130]|uniref:hypothetical protein n=1 Tax=Streptomyces sp. NPDC002130 TaxID=3155568 RepID=UPI0033226C99